MEGGRELVFRFSLKKNTVFTEATLISWFLKLKSKWVVQPVSFVGIFSSCSKIELCVTALIGLSVKPQ